MTIIAINTKYEIDEKTMKSLNQYLTESRKIYSFKIRLAVEPTSEVLDRIEKALNKFDTVSVSNPKRAPIQSHPSYFQDLENTAVWSIDAEVNYPTTSEIIKKTIQQLGISEKHIVVTNNHNEEDTTREEKRIEMVEKDSPLLIKELTKDKQMGNDDYAKELEKTVQNSVTGKIKVPNAPPKAKTTNDLPQGTRSPVGSTKISKPEPKSNRR